ncbi:lipid asymmetry maintenance protein MlaB [Marinobacter sp.]|uniref:STAS domain-containing protein n=1 Tax=Marinobacter sp. TaxID=50741 RepID=UPI0035672A68
MTASVRVAGERLELAGQVTADNVVDLRRQGEDWLSRQPGQVAVTIDLTSVSTASSLLLSLLLCWRRAAEGRSQSLTYEGASPDLLELSRLNGVASWLTGSP